MKKILIIFAVVMVIICGAVGLIYKSSISKDSSKSENSEQIQIVDLEIEDGSAAKISKTVDFIEGMTAQDTLNAGGVKFELKDYGSMGKMVNSINSKENGAQGKYWSYYINGVMGQVSASDYKIKAGDQIKWAFEIPKM